MGRYCKETALGGYKDVPGGPDDSEFEFYIASKEEYFFLQEQIRKLKLTNQEIRRDVGQQSTQAQNKISSQQTEIASLIQEKRQLEELCGQYKETVKQYEAELKMKAAELEQAIQAGLEAQMLNQNLKRIMKERANQNRGLTPKKDRSGYIVLFSQEWKDKCRVDIWKEGVDPGKYKTQEERAAAIQRRLLQIKTKTKTIWKTTIQTPVDSGIEPEPAEKMIDEDLLRGGILKALSIQSSQRGTDQLQEFADGLNVAYRFQYRANYRSGFWEVDVYTNLPVTVPADFRT